MKKALIFVLLTILLTFPVFAAPTDEEVGATIEGVFGVYGAIFLSTIMGQTVPGASMDMDMQTGSSTLTLNDVDTTNLYEAFGETLGNSENAPEIPFGSISGSFRTTAESTMDMDVTLGDGPVKSLVMKVEGEDLTVLKADGKNYLHLKDILDLME